MAGKIFKYFSGPVMVLFLIGIMAGCSSKADHSAEIREVMKVMKASAEELGEPRAHEDSLFFGTTRMNSNYQIVDSLQKEYGCTATFFVRKGEEFIRISTDVMLDGHRALGTDLDPNGPVIAAVKNGEPYYGNVDILGKPYETGYEPIKNASGEVIGAYYVGYQVEN